MVEFTANAAALGSAALSMCGNIISDLTDAAIEQPEVGGLPNEMTNVV